MKKAAVFNRYEQWENGDGYDRYITSELDSFRKEAWKALVTKHFDGRTRLKILDVGTGPGFFACILSEAGHDVTGIDQSEGMLEKAEKNARFLGVSPLLLQMNVNELAFPDETFDVVISRNVTWTLEHPEKVYSSFRRILRPGGMLLIYDANWHMHFFDEDLLKKVRAREQAYFEKYGQVEIVADNDPAFFATAPLTSTDRPSWDEEVLTQMGFAVSITEDIGRFVYEEWEKQLYAESPLFEICAVKPKVAGWEKRDTSSIGIVDGLQAYWGERSASYSVQNIAEMEDFRRDAWRKLILDMAPEKQRLRVLDVGTGPGFFAINLALAGHDVTGVDVTEEMLIHARANADAYGANAGFSAYDGVRLPFADNTFDMVVSRNVLWNIEEPAKALRDWMRVLKPGGRMVYFDANWYLYLFDEAQRVRHEAAHKRQHELFPGIPHDPMGQEKARYLEELALRLPLSREHRPGWDEIALRKLDMEIIDIEPDITQTVYNEYERVHNAASPMFRVCAAKRIRENSKEQR